ncbi:MAG: hypothetical protein AAB732_03030 [Patescibacteria group bacterium]
MTGIETKEKNERIDLNELRLILAQQKEFKVIEIFDTINKTSGEKDVSLCENKNGKKLILRIGEMRPLNFFPNGFKGQHFIIPKIYERQEDKIPYEIEEYLQGKLVSDLDKQQSVTGKIDSQIIKKLLAAFWEFQRVARNINLEQKFEKEKILKHFDKAKSLLDNPQIIQKLIEQYGNFWNASYPSKWKFATDNLIIIPDGRIGFIDNVGAGLRYFGYDLGWLLWPRWVEMETKRFDDVKDHLQYLEQFMKQIRNTAPSQMEFKNFDNKKFWLVIFERLIGNIYDVACNTRHLNDWGMGKDGENKRKEKHLAF